MGGGEEGKVLKTSEVIALGIRHGKDFKIQVPQSKRQRDIFVRQYPDQGFRQLLDSLIGRDRYNVATMSKAI